MSGEHKAQFLGVKSFCTTVWELSPKKVTDQLEGRSRGGIPDFSWGHSAYGTGGGCNRFCKNMTDPNMLMYGRRSSTLCLSPFICSSHLVDIVVLFIPDTGLVPGGK